MEASLLRDAGFFTPSHAVFWVGGNNSNELLFDRQRYHITVGSSTQHHYATTTTTTECVTTIICSGNNKDNNRVGWNGQSDRTSTSITDGPKKNITH